MCLFALVCTVVCLSMTPLSGAGKLFQKYTQQPKIQETNIIRSSSSVEDANDCARECVSINDCIGFTYNLSQSKCDFVGCINPELLTDENIQDEAYFESPLVLTKYLARGKMLI